MLKTGKDMFITKHYINDEGINNVFATNVLGHFAMVGNCCFDIFAFCQKVEHFWFLKY